MECDAEAMKTVMYTPIWRGRSGPYGGLKGSGTDNRFLRDNKSPGFSILYNKLY